MTLRRPAPAALAVLVALLAFVLWPAQAASAAAAASSGERIVSFTAEYDVQPDGSMKVKETLVWQFEGDDHHGIQRYIRTSAGYDPEPDKYRVYELTDAGASSPSGAPANLTVSEQGAETRLRVGDPDQTVSGRQTYVITYTLGHVVNGFDDHVELYWNVTGERTDIPTDTVRVTVRGPAAVTQAACYYGAKGSTDTCTATPGETATFAAQGLGPEEQVSVVAGFPTGVFTDTAPDLRDGETGYSGGDDGSTLTPAVARPLSLLGYGGGILAPVLAAGLMGLLVWKRGRDERYAGLTPGLSPVDGVPAQVVRGGSVPVAVQFQPPAGVRPGLVGTVVDETANTIDVSATVVDLAVRGHLTIEEVEKGGMFSKKDWRLTRYAPTETEPLLPYEQTLVDGIFKDANPVLLSELKNKFAGTLSIARKEMYDEVVRRGWFRKSPERQRNVWRGLGLFLIMGGFASGWFLGFNSIDIDQVSGIGFGFVSSGIVLAGGLILAGLIVMLLGQRMAAKTAEGSAVLAQSLGFKQYLVTAEARQIAFDEAANIFSRYLPYAIVFGVADRWAKTFAEVAAAAEAAGTHLASPVWYIGYGGYTDFGGIADGVDGFSTMASGTFTSTPGSSGSSGFGGGGFSGGGGGGGGSSSW